MSKDAQALALRRALGQFATGVTVVTTMTQQGPIGLTANSFASVSLDPPLVLWSLDRASDRFEPFAQAQHYAINVLSAEQRHLSEAFASFAVEPFEDLGCTPGLGDAPLVPGSVATFECESAGAHDGGDHVVLIGKVGRFDATGAAPLVFHQGRYKGVTV